MQMEWCKKEVYKLMEAKRQKKIDLKKVDELESDDERVREIVLRWAGRLRLPNLASKVDASLEICK